ncbi:hypothetical protein H257_13427 [Aphanomyces astaci]|uniref:Uncharacterized protein n=1 Tax=Aphanomyces astaci TaxID=112090 RepID=W4FUW5_APHAT|nr:hypothetical protein H257_13427 [Aphanomyces astaci]ETV71295.1 hypothetical protein H257_13427 [Aphanomyces astaci]|eukprot:XP_009839235.1 hypothetical protein H257_13427 [Aphanomyces astaci]
MASRRGVPMLDTASAAAVQQKNLRIIETFIASENSRELQLAQCKSVEKRGLLEMEFALARAHESKLLHRMMRKGDDSDRLEDEVHAMVVASSKRMHDIEAISSLPRSPFVKKKPPKRRVAAPATSYTTAMPAIKPRLLSMKAAPNSSKPANSSAKPAMPNRTKPAPQTPTKSGTAPRHTYAAHTRSQESEIIAAPTPHLNPSIETSLDNPPHFDERSTATCHLRPATPSSTTGVEQTPFECFFHAYMGTPSELLFSKVKEVVLDVEGFEVRVRKKPSATPVRPFTADATASTPGVRGVRALKVQHARDVVVHGDYERARTEDTATVQVPLDMGCQDALQVPDDTGLHVTLEVPVAANERQVRADKEGFDEARPVHAEFQEVLQIPVSTQALQVHTGLQKAPQVPADTRLQVAALQGRQNLQLNPPTPDSSTLSSFSEDGSSSAIPSAALENLQLNPPTPDASTLSSFSEDGSLSTIPSAVLDPPDQNDTPTLTIVDVALQVPAIETSSPGATTSTSQNVSPPMLLLQVHEVSESAVHSIVTSALHSLQSHSFETTYDDDDDTSYDVTPTLISPDKDRSSHPTTFAAAPTTQDLLAVAESFLPTAAEAPHDAQLEITSSGSSTSSSTTSSTKDAAIQVQRMVRGHHGRKQFRATLYREAQSCGVLGAMPGTTQGATGWYQEQTTFTAHYFVVLPSGEWRPKVQVKCPHMILTPYDMARHVHSVINVVDNID